MERREEPIRCEAPGAGIAEGSWTHAWFSPGERARRAGKVLALMLAIALPALFVPVFHFFVVPAAVGFGLAMALRRWLQREALLAAHITCPACEVPVTIDLHHHLPTSSLWTFCPACGVHLRLERPVEAAQPAASTAS